MYSSSSVASTWSLIETCTSPEPFRWKLLHVVGFWVLGHKSVFHICYNWIYPYMSCWMDEVGRVVVQGAGPGPRYGHVMSLVGQRFLLSISGNDGEFTMLQTDSHIELFVLMVQICLTSIYCCRKTATSWCMGSWYGGQTLWVEEAGARRGWPSTMHVCHSLCKIRRAVATLWWTRRQQCGMPASEAGCRFASLLDFSVILRSTSALAIFDLLCLCSCPLILNDNLFLKWSLWITNYAVFS